MSSCTASDISIINGTKAPCADKAPFDVIMNQLYFISHCTLELCMSLGYANEVKRQRRSLFAFLKNENYLYKFEQKVKPTPKSILNIISL